MVFVDAFEQASMSTAVVEATVGGHDTIQTAEGVRYTDTTLQLRSVIAGSAPDVFNVRQLGGELQGQIEIVHGDAKLVEGQRIVAMVRKVDQRWYLTAMGLSVWVIEGTGEQAAVIRDLDVEFYEPGPRGTEPARSTPLEFVTLGGLRDALAGVPTESAP